MSRAEGTQQLQEGCVNKNIHVANKLITCCNRATSLHTYLPRDHCTLNFQICPSIYLHWETMPIIRVISERGCITYTDGPLDIQPNEMAEFHPLLQQIETVAVADTGRCLLQSSRQKLGNGSSLTLQVLKLLVFELVLASYMANALKQAMLLFIRREAGSGISRVASSQTSPRLNPPETRPWIKIILQ